MAWLESKTVFVSTSLFCLPVLALCAVLCLPLVILATVSLYISAWAIHIGQHVSNTSSWKHLIHQLPTRPLAIIDINLTAFRLILAWITLIPSLLKCVKWRYWTMDRDQFSHIIKRNLVYSNDDQSTCKLDMYYPDMTTTADGSTSTPIVIFLHGHEDPRLPNHRFFYTPYANTLRELGYIVAVLDYRPNNYAHQDIKESIRWVYRHICASSSYESEMIYVMGHGTGAKLAFQVVLEDIFNKVKCHNLPYSSQASDMSNEKHDPSADEVANDYLPNIEGLLLFAGMYQDEALRLVKKHHELFETSCDLIDFFPRILFVHGDNDTMVSPDESVDMYNMLGQVLPEERRALVDVQMRLYKKLDHTRCITALVPRMASFPDKMQKTLIKDIQEFIDLPSDVAV
ncbi:alpha/beta-hydrolase [Lichtheimia hyalospora FSU 10163]|nr:alpha/beta-hydrolase [Lichtheimia hyalospora FSU 10163]